MKVNERDQRTVVPHSSQPVVGDEPARTWPADGHVTGYGNTKCYAQALGD